MIQLSTLPAPAAFAMPRPPGSPLATTSDFALALATISVPAGIAVAPPTPPDIDGVVLGDVPQARQPLAVGGMILPYAAIQAAPDLAIGTDTVPAAIDGPVILADHPPVGRPPVEPLRLESRLTAAESAMDAMQAPPPLWVADDAGVVTKRDDVMPAIDPRIGISEPLPWVPDPSPIIAPVTLATDEAPVAKPPKPREPMPAVGIVAPVVIDMIGEVLAPVADEPSAARVTGDDTSPIAPTRPMVAPVIDIPVGVPLAAPVNVAAPPEPRQTQGAVVMPTGVTKTDLPRFSGATVLSPMIVPESGRGVTTTVGTIPTGVEPARAARVPSSAPPPAIAAVPQPGEPPVQPSSAPIGRAADVAAAAIDRPIAKASPPASRVDRSRPVSIDAPVAPEAVASAPVISVVAEVAQVAVPAVAALPVRSNVPSAAETTLAPDSATRPGSQAVTPQSFAPRSSETAPVAPAPSVAPVLPASVPVAAPPASFSAPTAKRIEAPVVITVTPAPPAPVQQPAAQAFAVAMFAAVDRSPIVIDAEDPAADLAASFPLSGLVSAPAPLAVPAAGAPQQPALDLARDDWMGSMIDRIETIRDDAGVRETRIRLTPDALGSVDVSIGQDDAGVLQVRFDADSPQARAILAEAAPRLAEMAEARGLKLGGAGVDAGANHSQRQAQQSAASTPNRPASAATDDTETLSDTRIA